MNFKMLFIIFAASTALIACQGHKGDRGEAGLPGKDGESIVGPVGPRGEQGEPGVSCSALKVGTVTTITCGESVVQVMDGVDATPVETILLCPTLQGGDFQEYVVKISGSLFAVYSHGSKIGLAKLAAGDWVTTDGRSCPFTVTADGEVL